MGDRSIALSCDEFPFASSEEGGNFLSTLNSNPTTAQRTCVPAWQNTLQGNCNSEFLVHSVLRHRLSLTFSPEVLNKVQTNVLYGQPGGGENFVQWDNPSWLSTGPLGSATQRFAVYPNQIPQGNGVPTNVSSPLRASWMQQLLLILRPFQDYNTHGGAFGYMFRRNFTFGMALPATYNDGAAWTPAGGPAQSWTLASSQQFPPGTDGGDVTAIACAVNTFGQRSVYQADYNGLCFNGGSISSGRGKLFLAQVVPKSRHPRRYDTQLTQHAPSRFYHARELQFLRDRIRPRRWDEEGEKSRPVQWLGCAQ